MTRKVLKPAIADSGFGEEARALALLASVSLIALLSLICAFPAWGEDAASSPLDRLRDNWQARKSLIAHFSQTQAFAGFDEPVESRGTLRILRPSYFDILYDPPSRQRQVCDGTFVWTYVPEQKQVVKATLSPEATRGADLLDWALEGATLISSAPDDSMGGGGMCLTLEPGSQLPLQELRIWMRTADATLLGYEAVDTEGNRTRMRFLDLRPAKGLKPADFAFRPPAGVEVVEMGGGR
jgi:outer membrane lipoprotein-sorting protein